MGWISWYWCTVACAHFVGIWYFILVLVIALWFIVNLHYKIDIAIVALMSYSVVLTCAHIVSNLFSCQEYQYYKYRVYQKKCHRNKHYHNVYTTSVQYLKKKWYQERAWSFKRMHAIICWLLFLLYSCRVLYNTTPNHANAFVLRN